MIIDDMKKDLIKFIKERPFVFCGLIIYLGGLAIYCFCFADSKQLTLNEVGDFLAGAFSPLAFLFLYLGYKQQGEEMGRNTAALEKQELALTKSVEAQNRLIELQENEQFEKHFQVLPNFIIRNLDYVRDKYPDHDPDTGEILDYEEFLTISFDLENIGEIAKNVLLKSEENESYLREYKDIVNKNEMIEVKLFYDGQAIEDFETGAAVYNTLNLTYSDMYGKTYIKNIRYNINAIYDPTDGEFYFNVSADLKN